MTKFIFSVRLLSPTTLVNALPSPRAVIFVSWYSGCVAVSQEMNCCNAFPLTGRYVLTDLVCLPGLMGSSMLAYPRNTSRPRKSMAYTDKQSRGQPYVLVDWKEISMGKFHTITLPFPSSSLPFNARRETAIYQQRLSACVSYREGLPSWLFCRSITHK